MGRYSLILLIMVLNSIVKGQSNQQDVLTLKKKIPLIIRTNKLCGSEEIVSFLSDALRKEGFKLIDSTAARALAGNFFKETFSKGKTMKSDEHEYYLKQRFTNEELRQDLMISINHCLDTLYDFTVSVYVFPKHKKTIKRLNFALPFYDPAKIADVIISSIERK